jgi:hypothetical protein
MANRAIVYNIVVDFCLHEALVAQGLERSIADRQVPRSNRGGSFFFQRSAHASRSRKASIEAQIRRACVGLEKLVYV